MDPSNRQKFVLGELKVSVTDIRPAEAAEIVWRALSAAKPHLKYTSGFREIGEEMNTAWPDVVSTDLEDQEITAFPSGFSETTRCVRLEKLFHECEGNSAGIGALVVREKILLLTQAGQLVVWTARYQRGFDHKRFPGEGRVVDTATFSQFQFLEGEGLADFFQTQKPNLPLVILARLRTLMQEAIKERQRHIANMEGAANWIAGILSRLN